MSRAFDPLILLLGSWLKKTLPAWNSLHNSLHTVTSVSAAEKLEVRQVRQCPTKERRWNESQLAIWWNITQLLKMSPCGNRCDVEPS